MKNMTVTIKKDVVIYNLKEYLKIYKDICKIVDFYNINLPKSKHSVEFKTEKYNIDTTIVYVAVSDDEIIGLIESWIVEDGVRVLVTAITQTFFKKLGIFKQLYMSFYDSAMDMNTKKIILHFRDSNRNTHQRIYESVGFTNLIENGTYGDKELRWSMEKNIGV